MSRAATQPPRPDHPTMFRPLHMPAPELLPPPRPAAPAALHEETDFEPVEGARPAGTLTHTPALLFASRLVRAQPLVDLSDHATRSHSGTPRERSAITRTPTINKARRQNNTPCVTSQVSIRCQEQLRTCHVEVWPAEPQRGRPYPLYSTTHHDKPRPRRPHLFDLPDPFSPSLQTIHSTPPPASCLPPPQPTIQVIDHHPLKNSAAERGVVNDRPPPRPPPQGQAGTALQSRSRGAGADPKADVALTPAPTRPRWASDPAYRPSSSSITITSCHVPSIWPCRRCTYLAEPMASSQSAARQVLPFAAGGDRQRLPVQLTCGRSLVPHWYPGGGCIKTLQGQIMPICRPFMRGERGDSNPRPPGPQPGALPTELRPPRAEHAV